MRIGLENVDSPLRSLIRTIYGIETYVRETNVTAGTAQVQVVPNNGDRIGLLVVNNSDTPVNLSFNSGITVNNGIVLPANGGGFILNVDRDGQAPVRELWCITSAATKVLTVVETLLRRES